MIRKQYTKIATVSFFLETLRYFLCPIGVIYNYTLKTHTAEKILTKSHREDHSLSLAILVVPTVG